ncbi:hypothetical protein E2C01_021890 [Portunus trituberculatus]|uniref:Uncharacterized protein n=1 Tax=Portunus trituberculatus TaxID=210409 RepID=A0A5B7E3Z1_PORTR|nr:hypothetical protein [Portunus trituberculatus]
MELPGVLRMAWKTDYIFEATHRINFDTSISQSSYTILQRASTTSPHLAHMGWRGPLLLPQTAACAHRQLVPAVSRETRAAHPPLSPSGLRRCWSLPRSNETPLTHAHHDLRLRT